MDAITRSVFSLMKLRLRAIKRYDQKAEEIQYRQLDRVLRVLNQCRYRERFSDHPITNYESFRKLLPIVEYEDIRSEVGRMLQGEKNVLLSGGCSWFAQSSGTSGGRSKYLPVSGLHLQSSHYKGGSDTVWLYLSTRPDSELFKHKGLILGGSHKPHPIHQGIHAGDLSAILIENMPSFGKHFQVPDKKVLLMGEWTEKMKAIINDVRFRDVSSLSGVPSWMLEMITSLLESERKEHLTEIWPNLEVFFHGGISFEPYRKRYKELIPSERMQYRETYNASEGFFGVQNDPSDPSLLLMLDYGIFYEFIPFSELGKENPTILPLESVEVGVNYVILISTLGGLYRYQIGDLVQFTSIHPYKFLITGRTQHYINAFGEELMVNNTNDAIREVGAEMGVTVLEYTAAPLFRLEEAKGCHEWIVEFENPEGVDVELFEQRLDEELRKLNSDYDAKRYADMTLTPLKVIPARKNLFRDWLAGQGKLGGQHKIPRLRNDRGLLETLLKMND